MPRYFFHIEDGIFLPDQEGTELPNLETVRNQGIAMAGSILRNGPDGLWAGHPWRMVVTDEERKVLFRLDFALQRPAIDEATTTADLRQTVTLLTKEAADHTTDVKRVTGEMRGQIEETRRILASWGAPPLLQS